MGIALTFAQIIANAVLAHRVGKEAAHILLKAVGQLGALATALPLAGKLV